MTAGTKPLTKRPAWLALEAHHEAIGGLHLWGEVLLAAETGEALPPGLASQAKLRINGTTGWRWPTWFARRWPPGSR